MKKLKAEVKQYALNYAKITLYQSLGRKELLATNEKEAIHNFLKRMDENMDFVYLDESTEFAGNVEGWIDNRNAKCLGENNEAL